MLPGWMRRLPAALALVLAVTLSQGASAQTKVAEAAQQLKTSDDYRVRTQAALALGASGDAAAVQPLCGGLKDKTPVVRSAAAAALGKLGKSGGLSCLKGARPGESDTGVAAQIDQSIGKLEGGGGGDAPPPPGPNAKYYVAIEVANKSSKPAGEVEKLVRSTLQSKLLGTSGFAIAPKAETPAQGGQVVKTKNLKGFYLIATVEAPVYANGNLVQSLKLSIWSYPEKALKGQVSPKLTQSGTPSADPAGETELIKMCSESAAGSFIKIVGTLQ